MILTAIRRKRCLTFESDSVFVIANTYAFFSPLSIAHTGPEINTEE